MKLIAALLKYINTVVLAFFGGFKDIVAFLTIEHLLVIFSNHKVINRNLVKCFTSTGFDMMYAILTGERHRFQMIDKVFHCSCLRYYAAKIQKKN